MDKNLKNNTYYKRIIDKEFDLSLRALGATNLVGVKWCGKTRTAKERAKSTMYLQDDPNKEGLIETSKINPIALLDGEKPKLIDEWEEAFNIWDVIRGYCDDSNHKKGLFILTSSNLKKVKTSHTGTGRICTLKMYPMSLYESLESNGTVSLMDLFNGKENLEMGCHSDLSIDDLIFAACRGGWPESLLSNDKEEQLSIAKNYLKEFYLKELFEIDDVKRNKETMKAVLKSYAKNISTLAKTRDILKDVNNTNSISDTTLDDYINVLERLYLIEDIKGWRPNIRNRSAIRAGRKREFVDPSIAVAALNTSPKYYSTDLLSFRSIFENLCIRDLKIYSQEHGGDMHYYHDKTGLEVDTILEIEDGRYALIEFKLGGNQIEEGVKNLLKVERLIKKYNDETKKVKIRMPDLKIVITGTAYGYKRPDGVYIIPIGCLKD